MRIDAPWRLALARCGPVCALLFFALDPGGSVCRGQEALGLSLAGEAAARSRRVARELQPYSFKAGDAEVRLGGGVITEWNDNITLVEEDTMTDVILRPYVRGDLSWPITSKNYLDASVVAGYSKYLSHGEFDRAYVLPGSALSFDLFFRDVRLTLRDRISYHEDPAERAVVAGTAEFGGLENFAGLQLEADWGDLGLSFSYDHQLFISTVDEFDYLNRSSHQLFAQLRARLASDLQVGIETGLTPTTYRDSFLRDNLSSSAGAFALWTVSPHLAFRLRGGAVAFHYDSTDTSAAQDVLNYYYSLGVTHQLRKAIGVTLDLGQESQLGVNNDLTEQFYLRHGVHWMISRKFSASGSFTYENGEESGIRAPESYNRFSFMLSGSWQWSRRWNARLSWRFISRESDVPLRGYDNNQVQVELGYQY